MPNKDLNTSDKAVAGEIVTLHFKDGGKYVGEVNADGKRHGKGKFMCAEDDIMYDFYNFHEII